MRETESAGRTLLPGKTVDAMARRSRAIYGCSGCELLPEERAFFGAAQPWGFILFSRNIADPQQVRALVSSLRETVGDERAPILIDQEGGRVARLKAPHWKAHPPWRRFGDLYRHNPQDARDAAYANAHLIAQELADLGINVDCVPVLDVPVEGADAVIGDRAFSDDPQIVAALGNVVIEAMLHGGVLPVMKHIPGHGRATADSHHVLPRVSTSADELLSTDFAPFRALKQCPIAMTAHVVYEALDPGNPATTSTKIIREVIRGAVGFGGLLISDDLSMKALSGSIGQRGRAALAAGCDLLLHCNGQMDEMQAIAAEASALEGQALERADAALAKLHAPRAFDTVAADALLDSLFGVSA
jgi:beta-N-acetylhexosaminidase